MKAIYEIDGYGIVLPQVQNYYPVELDKTKTYYWGFKYLSGIFEYFHYANKRNAEIARDGFICALNYYWVKNDERRRD